MFLHFLTQLFKPHVHSQPFFLIESNRDEKGKILSQKKNEMRHHRTPRGELNKLSLQVTRATLRNRACLHIANTQLLSGISTVQITRHILVVVLDNPHNKVGCRDPISPFCFLEFPNGFYL